jgi:CHAD domain-containing protein
MEKNAPTVAEVAYELIRQQYDRMIKEEPGVLADDDSECLHQMRVGSRRLCTALQVFSHTVILPKAASQKRVRALLKTLGKLRDLDVQIEAIPEKYYPKINSAEQKQLHKLLTMIKKQRGQRFAEVKAALTHSHHHQLKKTYENWLNDPQYTAIAHLPLTFLWNTFGANVSLPEL